MDFNQLGFDTARLLDDLLGYMNLSSGKADSRFRRNWNELFRRIYAADLDESSPWKTARKLLAARLSQLRQDSQSGGAFADASQVEAAIDCALVKLPAAYRQFHADLLHHQTDAALFQPWFLARCCEAVLTVGAPWDQADRIVAESLSQLNDMVGYRPVAVLRTPQRVEPYPHEWFCPIPIYWRDVGVASGVYHDLITRTIEILRSTDRDLLERAWFDFDLLDELAIDPRAYDFDHPVNKRPNHQFGQWDPHRLDTQGRYRRFVLQSVALDAIWQRTQNVAELPASELVFEAAAVLAGTTLMAAAIGGRSPETHDSGVTLAHLLPQIASLRDDFYARLLATVPDKHGQRLRAEAERLRQPFGGARQNLNQCLARLRAAQLEDVHLALLYARMGQPEASRCKSARISVASARILCRISDRLRIGNQHIDRGAPEPVFELLAESERLLHAGIECGALVDPWNILGFQGQFSLFPALENSVRDHRVDVLIHVLRQIFDLHVRLCGEAAAQGHQELRDRAMRQVKRLARWWDQFASVEVSDVERLSGAEAATSAEQVGDALGAWFAGGAAAGDVAFWRKHVENFQAPKSYALVVTALLDKRDYVASRALLMQWLGQAEQTPLAEGDYSFHELALRWLGDVARRLHAGESENPSTWSMVQKFFDHLEANAETWWEVPQLTTQGAVERHSSDDDEDDADDDPGDTFEAAYETMVYRDSTRDGREGNTMDGDAEDPKFDLDAEGARIGHRLAFLLTVGRLWQLAATASRLVPAEQCRDALAAAAQQAQTTTEQLLTLLDAVGAVELAQPLGTQASLVEFDRQRSVKESLLARIIVTTTETAAAARLLTAALDGGADAARCSQAPAWECQARQACRHLLRGEAASLRTSFDALVAALETEPVLYIPLARNGCPRKIVAAQSLQQFLLLLARELPRQGLLAETARLLDVAQDMEKQRPSGEGAVTEFDRLFETAAMSMFETLAETAGRSDVTEQELVDVAQQLVEALVPRWLTHSRGLRLSVVEKVVDRQRWEALVKFIEQYGHEIFTPRFFNLGNLRAILHQGCERYLQQLIDEEECSWKLLDDLDQKIPRADAVEQLRLCIEALVENYAEFKDYNTTTTQSDRGELLHVLIDFLRLKVGYDRFAWNIRPVLLAHDALVRRGKMAAAEIWRRSVVARTADAADWYLRKHQELTRQYGVRLATIADRINERFVHSLAVDRIRALVAPAVEEPRAGLPPTAFKLLEQELNDWSEHPTGSGLDVPTWLSALEQEAEQVLARLKRHGSLDDEWIGPPAELEWNALVAQVRALAPEPT